MTKALAKVAKQPAEPAGQKTDGWELAGLSEERQAEANAIKAVVTARPRRPRAVVTYDEDRKATVRFGDPDVPGDDVLNSIRLFGAIGSSSNEFADDMIRRVADAVALTGDPAADSQRVSGAFALIASVDPQNELEATMALQMVAANESALLCFSRSRNAQYMEHAAPYANMANKAMRSFALHAEALAKLRRGGEQVVKHVHVNEGGQAVIAQTVNTGGGG